MSLGFLRGEPLKCRECFTYEPQIRQRTRRSSARNARIERGEERGAARVRSELISSLAHRLDIRTRRCTYRVHIFAIVDERPCILDAAFFDNRAEFNQRRERLRHRISDLALHIASLRRTRGTRSVETQLRKFGELLRCTLCIGLWKWHAIFQSTTTRGRIHESIDAAKHGNQSNTGDARARLVPRFRRAELEENRREPSQSRFRESRIARFARQARRSALELRGLRGQFLRKLRRCVRRGKRRPSFRPVEIKHLRVGGRVESADRSTEHRSKDREGRNTPVKPPANATARRV